jgi:hypothetical protein
LLNFVAWIAQICYTLWHMVELPPELAPDSRIVSSMIQALDHAYRAVAASHDEEIGCDNYTYGTGVWRSGRHYLRIAFESDSEVEPVAKGNAFVLKTPVGNLFSYRDRSTNRVDEKHPFSGASQVKDLIVLNNQLCLGFIEPVDAKDADGIWNFVVLHRGNHIEGLTEVYIGLPYFRSKIKTTAWAFIERVFQNTSGVLPDVLHEMPDVTPFSSREVPEIYLEERAYLIASDGTRL